MEQISKIENSMLRAEGQRELLKTLTQDIQTLPKKTMHPQISAILQQDIATLAKNLK
jgi:hypothetical protein